MTSPTLGSWRCGRNCSAIWAWGCTDGADRYHGHRWIVAAGGSAPDWRSFSAPAEISSEQADLEANATDWSAHRLPGAPLAVLRPGSVPQVQAILKVASAAGVPVVPRGRGTGLSGGAAVPDGALVVSTERLDRILKIDAADGIAVVQPGVITAELDAAASEHGLRYAPDPASSDTAAVIGPSDRCRLGDQPGKDPGGLE